MDMEARIGHVTDARDTRPAWGITYRRYVDVRSSHVRVQADDLNAALAALAEYIGNNQYAVTAIYAEAGESTGTSVEAQPEPLDAATSALYAAALRAEQTAKDAQDLAESLTAAAKEARAAYESASMCADALRSRAA
jgi:hypothetical protein